MVVMFRRRPAVSLRAVGALAALLLVAACRPAVVATPASDALVGAAPAVRLVAHAVIPTGTRVGAYEVGGLSGLAYDRAGDLFYAVVDDANGYPPARLLRLRWHPPAAPEPVDWLVLTEASGASLPTVDADLEGVARRTDGTLFVSSEGNVNQGYAPWVGRFDSAGRLQERLRVPDAFVPRAGHGVHHNLAFEGLTLEPGDGSLLAGTEGPLVQDEPAPAGELARARLLRWDLRRGGEPRQWLYPLDPPHAAPPLPGALRVAGLSELLAFPAGGADHALALERSYVAGVGFAVKLYEMSLVGAAEVTGVDAVGGREVRTAGKRLLADFGALGVPIDNYEGMAWGPAGADGTPLLVVIVDNNFRAEEQTHLAAFALTPRARARATSASR